MEIVRKELNPNEIAPTNRRYNPETDGVEFTPDGGTTWNPDPNDDPRHNPGLLLPPRTGEDVRCDAAEAMMQHFKSQVDAFLTSASILQLVSTWLLLLAFIPGVGVLIALIFAIADALFVTGTTVVDAAMTEAVYEQIKCLIYCVIDADGMMTADDVARLYLRVNDQIGGVAAEVFTQVTSAWGEVGFSNAGATGEYTGDCSGCDACEWCYEWDFTASDGGFTIYRGSYSAGVGFVSEVGAGFVAATIWSPTCGGVCNADIDRWETQVTISGAAGNGYISNWYATGGGDFNPIGYMDYLGVPTYPGYGAVNGSAEYTYDEIDPTAYPNIGINAVVNDEEAQTIITHLRVRGSGVIPDFTGGSIC